MSNEKVKFDEQELADIFQVEELEKRYEMGWASGGKGSGEINWSEKDGWSVGTTFSVSF